MALAFMLSGQVMGFIANYCDEIGCHIVLVSISKPQISQANQLEIVFSCIQNFLKLDKCEVCVSPEVDHQLCQYQFQL